VNSYFATNPNLNAKKIRPAILAKDCATNGPYSSPFFNKMIESRFETTNKRSPNKKVNLIQPNPFNE
jgi:hypothetical protein